MFEIERHKIICEMLEKQGRIQAAEIAKKLNVSHETVRKDILALEKKGMLTRAHGGAVAIQTGKMVEFKHLKSRMDDFPELKKEVAENAIRFINEGDVIAIDAGTTAIYLAELLRERFSRLTVVTYCMSTFERLQGVSKFRVILLGGEFSPEENAFTGHLTVEAMSKIHVMKSFVLPSAISAEKGLGYMHAEFVESAKCLIKMADEVFVLGDSSKFEQYAMYKVSDAESRFTYITDSDISGEIAEKYENAGLKLVGVEKHGKA